MCGVRICERAGSRSSRGLGDVEALAAPAPGTRNPGVRASAVQQRARGPGRAARASSRSWISSSASPRTSTSTNGASGTGLEKVSGPPATTSGSRAAALVGEHGHAGRARARRTARPARARRRPRTRAPGSSPTGRLRLVGEERACGCSRTASTSSGRKARSALAPGCALISPVDGLEAERAHPHVVRARVAEGDAVAAPPCAGCPARRRGAPGGAGGAGGHGSVQG